MAVLLWFFLAVVCAVIVYCLWYAFKPVNETESFTERPRVVVSFTTIPSRLPFLGDVAEQMQKQTYQPDRVYACIPQVSARFGTAYDMTSVNIPSNLTVIRTDDYGPATKLLGCLEYERDPDTIVITIDDDVVYSENLIKNLVQEALENPDKRVGSRATSRRNTYPINYKKRNENSESIMLEGFGGIAYRRGMISDETRQRLQTMHHDHPCWKSDDVTFDRLITYQKIKVPNLVDTTDTPLEHLDALQDDARKATYKQCFVALGD